MAKPRRATELIEKVFDRISEWHTFYSSTGICHVDHRPTHLLNNIRIFTNAWIGQSVLYEHSMDRLGPETRRCFVDRIVTTTLASPAAVRIECHRHKTH
jgi:hypothetical protein